MASVLSAISFFFYHLIIQGILSFGQLELSQRCVGILRYLLILLKSSCNYFFSIHLVGILLFLCGPEMVKQHLEL